MNIKILPQILCKTINFYYFKLAITENGIFVSLTYLEIEYLISLQCILGLPSPHNCTKNKVF